MEAEEKRGPGRPKTQRSEQAQTQRRRRNTDALSGKRRRMYLNTAELDNEKFVYRWANTDPGRIESLTQQDDWEVVQDRDGKIKNDVVGDGSKVSIVAGAGESGSPVQAVLLRKPKEFQDEDRQAKKRRIDEQEAALRQGATPGGEGASGESFYTTDNGIRIEQGGRQG